MDERNKKRVWDMILNAAGKGSQYFHLAPKMPYSMQYKPGTLVHMCHASKNFSKQEVYGERGRARLVSAAKMSRRS